VSFPARVIEGIVARTLLYGSQRVLQLYGPGQYVGFDGAGLPPNVAVLWQAETDCVLSFEPSAEAREEALAAQLREATLTLLMNEHRLEERLDTRLRRVLRLFGQMRGGEWLLDVSRQRLALYVGTTAEQISRHLSRLVAQGLAVREGYELVFRAQYLEE
jgi:CRP-like cAMP-binding protein